MRRVAQIMGLPFSVDVPDATDESIFEDCWLYLRSVDERFSTYKPDSEVSRLRAGELPLDAISVEQQEVMDACRSWQAATDGYFDAWYDGLYEPSGYVKGWAIQGVADRLKAAGYGTFCVNGGGDIVCASDSDYIWRIALQHPAESDSVMGEIAGANQAIATSGSYARGNHIMNPIDETAACGVLSVTVVGQDIIASDVYATALCAMGFERAQIFAKTLEGYRVLLIAPDLTAFSTK